MTQRIPRLDAIKTLAAFDREIVEVRVDSGSMETGWDWLLAVNGRLVIDRPDPFTTDNHGGVSISVGAIEMWLPMACALAVEKFENDYGVWAASITFNHLRFEVWFPAPRPLRESGTLD